MFLVVLFSRLLVQLQDTLLYKFHIRSGLCLYILYSPSSFGIGQYLSFFLLSYCNVVPHFLVSIIVGFILSFSSLSTFAHSYFFSLNCPINQSVSISIETSISCCSTSLIIEAADTFRKSSISMSSLIMHQILDCQVLCILTSKRVLCMSFADLNRSNT